MAKVVLSPLVTSIRGKLGNGVATVWKGIQVIRAVAAVITNPQSSGQQFIRKLMTDARAGWQALSGPDKNTWEEMADLVKDFPLPPGGINNLVPKLGGPMSGFNCFISFFMSAITAGHPAITGPAPLGEIRPNAPNGVNASYLSPTVTLAWTDPTIHTTGAKLRIWLRDKQTIYHRQLLATEELAISTAALVSARGSKGATIAFTVPEVAGNDRLFLQMDTVNPSGLRSAGSDVAGVSL